MTSNVEPLVPGPLPDVQALRELLAPGGGPRVSVYLPVHRPFHEVKKNELMRESAVQTVAAKLSALELDEAQVAAWSARLRALDDDVRRLDAGAETLGVFLDARGVRAYALPAAVPCKVTVGACWALRPLLKALRLDQRYLALLVSGGAGGALRPRLKALRLDQRYLALLVSARRVALFEGGPGGLRPAASGLPASLEEALGSETTEKELRVRGTRAGGGAPVFYSHGSAREERKLDMERFHQVLARALESELKSRREPLVLVGTEPNQAGLRAVAHLPTLLPEGVHGNPDRLSDTELHAQTWPLVAAAQEVAEREAAAAFEKARNHGKAVDLLDDVGAAAQAGRVRRLWVDAERSVPGHLEAATGRVIECDGDDDVLDALAQAVIGHAGEVWVVDAARVPGTSGAAAELR